MAVNRQARSVGANQFKTWLIPSKPMRGRERINGEKPYWIE
jgi:hypothetical protein